jgi:hypothetical protein
MVRVQLAVQVQQVQEMAETLLGITPVVVAVVVVV